MTPAPSPPPDDDLPPPERAPGTRQRRRMRAAVLTIVGVVALVAGLIAAVVVIVPTYPRGRKQHVCEEHLERIAEIYGKCAEDPAWRPRSGPVLLLAWRKDGKLIPAGDEGTLSCPGDQSVAPPDTPEARARYDAVDLDDPPDGLCSYAVRDFARFPVDPEHAEDEPIAGCVGRYAGPHWNACHRDVVARIAFADGSVRELDRADLGIAPGGAPVVGPDSPSPLLRVLCFRPGVTERDTSRP